MRDGNQSLFEPMDAQRKLRLFQMLCPSASSRSRSAFPSASQTDFDFVRELIEEDLIPEDVTIQVLTQAREDLIRRTFESLRGAQARDRASLQRHCAGLSSHRVRHERGRSCELAVASAHADP